MSSRITRFARRLPVGGLALLTLALGCSADRFAINPFSSRSAPTSAPAASTPAAEATPVAPPLAAEPFSVERAWAHLVALSDLGPRPAGSTANHEALEYIRSRLEELNLEVMDVEYTGNPEKEGDEPAVLMTHVTARIPGESPDSILLVAHFDTFDRSPGANEGASGPAVLLELARQLVERPLPYTVELLFLDGDMGYLDDAPLEPLYEGGQMMADYLTEAGTLDVVRLAVFFGQVGDADLTIGRDLHSDRYFREVFFDTAEKLGFDASFPRDRGYTETSASHRAFIAAGMPRVVLLNDPWYGGDEMPGEYYGGEYDVRDHCAPQSLHTVGVVTLAALRQISAELQKVDLVSGRAARRKAESLERPTLEEESVEEEAPVAEGEASSTPEGPSMAPSAASTPSDEASMAPDDASTPSDEASTAPDDASTPSDEASTAPDDASTPSDDSSMAPSDDTSMAPAEAPATEVQPEGGTSAPAVAPEGPAPGSGGEDPGESS